MRKKYGIDITNAKSLDHIREKWEKRDYNKDLDQFWIVVVANHSYAVFRKLNEESPENVLVIDYRNLVTFLNGLNTRNIPFSIPPEKQRKLDALAQCTFYNREKIMKQFQNEKEQKKIGEFME